MTNTNSMKNQDPQVSPEPSDLGSTLKDAESQETDLPLSHSSLIESLLVRDRQSPQALAITQPEISADDAANFLDLNDESSLESSLLKRSQFIPSQISVRCLTSSSIAVWGELRRNQVLHSGSRVLILSRPSVESTILQIATIAGHCVAIPLDSQVNSTHLLSIVIQTKPQVIAVENQSGLNRVLQLLKNNASKLRDYAPKTIVSLGLAGISESSTVPVLTLPHLLELGLVQLQVYRQEFVHEAANIHPQQVAIVAFTSGTDGPPKGTMLSHENILMAMDHFERAMGDHFRAQDQILTLAPAHHHLTRLAEWIGVCKGIAIAFEESALQKPGFLFCQPHDLEQLKARILHQLESKFKIKRSLIEWALECASHDSESLYRILGHRVAQRTLFKDLRSICGGNLRMIITSGSVPRQETLKFFDIIGLPVLPGYGLNETTSLIALNTISHYRSHTSGKPLGDVEIKIDEDGEILIRSGQNMVGYFASPQASDQVFTTDGFLHTGDIGRLDSDGYLIISEKKGHLIEVEPGLYIAPQRIESIAKNHVLIDQFVVTHKPGCSLTALITLNPDRVFEYAAEHQLLYTDYAALTRNQKVRAWVEEIVNRLNENLSPNEKIRKFVILADRFSLETGEITSNQKINRKLIERRYHREITEMLR